ncbi:MAG: hypothetical protein ACREGH_00335, partial [Minisyncoccia bacterium]
RSMLQRPLARFTFKQLLIYIVVAAAILAFLGYGVFEARFLIEGPKITVLTPKDGAAVGGPLITIAGNVQNTAFFSIDGRQAFADEQGNFSETLTPAPGYDVVEIAAKDRFGRTAETDLEITVLPECMAS